MAIKQHAAMYTTTERHVANLEEIQPHTQTGREDLPLIIFTLLGQMAAGSIWVMTWMFATSWALIEYDAMYLRLLPTLLISACLGIGMLASVTHLGNKKNAWRVFSNVKRSSLGKEVLFTGLFGLGLLLVLLGILLHQRPDIFLLLASVAGAGMVYHMAQVYRLPAAPGWNSWRTNAGFFVSALLLGIAAMIPLLTFESNMTGIRVPSVQWGVTGFSVLVLLLAQFSLMRNPAAPDSIQRTRIDFMLIGTALAAIITVHVGAAAPVVSMLMSVFVVSAEILGRWVFYRSRL